MQCNVNVDFFRQTKILTWYRKWVTAQLSPSTHRDLQTLMELVEQELLLLVPATQLQMQEVQLHSNSEASLIILQLITQIIILSSRLVMPILQIIILANMRCRKGILKCNRLEDFVVFRKTYFASWNNVTKQKIRDESLKSENSLIKV